MKTLAAFILIAVLANLTGCTHKLLGNQHQRYDEYVSKVFIPQTKENLIVIGGKYSYTLNFDKVIERSLTSDLHDHIEMIGIYGQLYVDADEHVKTTFGIRVNTNAPEEIKNLAISLGYSRSELIYLADVSGVRTKETDTSQPGIMHQLNRGYTISIGEMPSAGKKAMHSVARVIDTAIALPVLVILCAAGCSGMVSQGAGQ